MKQKYEGNISTQGRKYIRLKGLICIGKEANNIEDQSLDVTGAQVFVNEEEIK